MYFVKAKWPRDWITTAEGILRGEWTKTYKVPVESGPTVTTVRRCLSLTICTFLNQPQTLSSSNNYFAELDTFTSDPAAGDALDEWLASPPLGTVTDLIAWWMAMEAAGHPLARMALDFLSTPGMPLVVIIHVITHVNLQLHPLMLNGPSRVGVSLCQRCDTRSPMNPFALPLF